MKKKVIVLVLLLLFTCSCGKETVKLENYIDKLENVTAEIAQSFSCNGYIRAEKGNLVFGLPEDSAKVDKAVDYLFYERTSAYFSTEDNTVIYLQVYPDEGENRWNSVIDNTDFYTDAPNGDFGEKYIPIGASVVSFTYDHLRYTLLCISENDGPASDGAGSRVADFTHELVLFLENL